MAGFSDLVGRNAPALGVNRAAYTAGDTWGDTIGVFTDDNGTPINLSGVTITITIYDKVGGSALANTTGSGTNVGTFSFAFNTSTTAGLINVAQHGNTREAVWNCTFSQNSSTVTVWAAVESPLTILAD